MSTITKRQADYIKILSSYDYSKKEDEEDIANCLKEDNKQTVSQLSKWEASELMEILLRRHLQTTLQNLNVRFIFCVGRVRITMILCEG
jgi:hypothetical protein